jgi:hypothetical protein
MTVRDHARAQEAAHHDGVICHKDLHVTPIGSRTPLRDCE